MSEANSIDMPSFLKGCKYLSPLKYVVDILAAFAFRGVRRGCEEGQRLPGGNVRLRVGKRC